MSKGPRFTMLAINKHINTTKAVWCKTALCYVVLPHWLDVDGVVSQNHLPIHTKPLSHHGKQPMMWRVMWNG